MTQRRVLAIVTLTLLVVMPWALKATANEKASGTAVTITGEVLDSACFFSHDARGKDHKKCAVNCAKKGIPMALIDAQENIYLLNEVHEKADAYNELKNHAGDTVSVTGKLVEKGGMKVIFVEAFKPAAAK